MVTKNKPPRYCAQCGELIEGKGPCITTRQWYHDECLPDEAMLQMMFHPPHEPGTPVTPEEIEEVSLWMTAASNRRLQIICADLTKKQTMEIARRMTKSTLSVQVLDKDQPDPKNKLDLR